MKVPVRTVMVAPPSTSNDKARVTMPAAPWEQAERLLNVTPAAPAKGPAKGGKRKPKGGSRK